MFSTNRTEAASNGTTEQGSALTGLCTGELYPEKHRTAPIVDTQWTLRPEA